LTTDLYIPELSIVVAGRNHNPTVLNPDFLRYNDVVPSEWVLRDNDDGPVSSPVFSQVDYDNGVRIVAQPDRIAFSVSCRDVRAEGTPDLAALVIKYVRTLPHVNYQAVGVNLDGHLQAEEGIEAARHMIVDRYLAKGPWLEFSGGASDATIALIYELKDAVFRLSISAAHYAPATVVEPDESKRKSVPVIHLSGNFQTEIEAEERDERLNTLVELLENWRGRLDTFVTLIESKIMNANDPAHVAS